MRHLLLVIIIVLGAFGLGLFAPSLAAQITSGASPQAGETPEGPEPVVTVPEPIDNDSEIVIIVSNGSGAFKDHAQAVHVINDTHHCFRYFNESNWPDGTNVTCVDNDGLGRGDDG